MKRQEIDDLVKKILKKKRGQYSESLASTIEIESFEDVIQHLGNMLYGMETSDASSIDDEIAVDVALGIINMVKELI